MRNKIIASLLVAASFSFAAPVFASGYGPAPFYHPADGAPTSQRGQSAETLASNPTAADARESSGMKATTETGTGWNPTRPCKPPPQATVALLMGHRCQVHIIRFAR